jgi:hypothetical protein
MAAQIRTAGLISDGRADDSGRRACAYSWPLFPVGSVDNDRNRVVYSTKPG